MTRATRSSARVAAAAVAAAAAAAAAASADSDDEEELEASSRRRGRARSRGKPPPSPSPSPSRSSSSSPSPSPPPPPPPEAAAAAAAAGAEQGDQDDPMDVDPLTPAEIQDFVRDRLRSRTLANARHMAAFYAHYDPENNELFEKPLRSRNPDFDEEGDNAQAGSGEAEGEAAEAKIVVWSPTRTADLEAVRLSAVQLRHSLYSKCLEVLCRNIHGVESLEGVPESMKGDILLRLMEMGKIRFKAARLFIEGNVPRIAIPDCSKLTPEEFTELFESCFIDGIETMELGFCGRALRDQFLHGHRFTHLKRLRLHGNHLITDDGMRACVLFSRGLTEVELVECSQVTESAVDVMASCLGSNLRKLSLDGCNSMRGPRLAPFLNKLTGLTSLSLARVEGVTDEIVSELMATLGADLEELDLSGCTKVSDEGLLVVAACCPRMNTLQLEGLELLTDRTLARLAEGCKSLRVVSLDDSREFSDEGLAKLFTACGRSLRSVSLRGVRQAGDHTLVALAKHAKDTLEKLDASFCRKMTDDGFGNLADSCVNLQELTLFGCSQITDKFVYGHSNKLLRLVGV